MSQINEEIIRRLSERYPTKTFKPVLKMDPHSHNPWVMIACNDKETPYGYFPSVVETLQNPNEFVDSFLHHNAARFETF